VPTVVAITVHATEQEETKEGRKEWQRRGKKKVNPARLLIVTLYCSIYQRNGIHNIST
jgi:hypothetical protein